MRRSSKDLYVVLSSILSLCDTMQLTEVYDGKSVENSMEFLYSAFTALWGDISAGKSGAKAAFLNIIDQILGADNSCGGCSNRIGELFLSPAVAADMKRITSERYLLLHEQLQEIKTFTAADDDRASDEYPFLLRIEISKNKVADADVSKPNDRGQWKPAHSYVVLVHSEEEINVLQAYAGRYSLTEWLHDDLLLTGPSSQIKRRGRLNGLRLCDYFDHLNRLLSTDPVVRKAADVFLHSDKLAHANNVDVPRFNITIRREQIDVTYALLQCNQLLVSVFKASRLYPVGFQYAVLERQMKLLALKADGSDEEFRGLLSPDDLKTRIEAMSMLRRKKICQQFSLDFDIISKFRLETLSLYIIHKIMRDRIHGDSISYIGLMEKCGFISYLPRPVSSCRAEQAAVESGAPAAITVAL